MQRKEKESEDEKVGETSKTCCLKRPQHGWSPTVVSQTAGEGLPDDGMTPRSMRHTCPEHSVVKAGV